MQPVNDTLKDVEISWSSEASCCLILQVAVSGQYKTGYEIRALMKQAGLSFILAQKNCRWQLYNSRWSCSWVTLGDILSNAVKKAYEAAKPIHFKDMHFRKDIGKFKNTCEDKI